MIVFWSLSRRANHFLAFSLPPFPLRPKPIPNTSISLFKLSLLFLNRDTIMSEEGSLGNLWENDLWALSNSNNSGGGGENLGKISLESSTNSPMSMETATEATLKGQKRCRKGVSKGKKDGSGSSESDEGHIWTERERRKKMRNMFSSLHALLPHVSAKANKSSIVDEGIKYIKSLQHTLQTLQKQKLEKIQSGNTIHNEPSMVMSQAPSLFGLCQAYFSPGQGSLKKNLSVAKFFSASVPILASPACFQTWFSPNVVMSMNGDDAHISVCSKKKPGLLTTLSYILENHNLDVLSAHIFSDHYRSMYMIHANAGGAFNQFSEAMPVEEVFKLAVGEMNFYLASC